MQSAQTHQLIRHKRISVKFQARRRCWTEICRKVDGPEKTDTYTPTCFQVFLQTGPEDRK
jgi:hypothetical protein